MPIVTAWSNADHHVLLAQLSDDPEDGTAQEQIAHLATLGFLSGYSCVDPNYTGTAPETDASLWRWSDGSIVAVEPVPASVTPRQVRLLLLSQNLLSQVEGIIATSDEATKITWAYASEFRRDDPLLEALSQQLGLTTEQVDAFFIAASKL
jgi:hypothetical protein